VVWFGYISHLFGGWGENHLFDPQPAYYLPPMSAIIEEGDYLPTVYMKVCVFSCKLHLSDVAKAGWDFKTHISAKATVQK
jgi:hypothetical protein